MYHIGTKFGEKFKRLPIMLPILVVLLCSYGFVVQYSASGGNLHPYAYKQILVFAIYFPVCLLIAFVNVRFFYQGSIIFYLFSILLLVLVAVVGKKAMGATRWIDLGLFRIQPSELAKISVVLVLAKYFHQADIEKIRTIRGIILPAILLLVPAALVVKQPDLGTGMIILGVGAIMFFAAGVPLLYFILAGGAAIISMPIIWMMLHDYQKTRILVFLDPEREPLGAGYNIIQSKIAIGSGGLTGKGFLQGTQSHLRFLPEYQTDFIFSFLTEELGFIGGMVLLILYCLTITYSLAIAINARAKFVKLTVIGLTAILFCNIFINIAMVMGMLPVVGEPLPLISSGGTMMVTMLLSFGLIMNGAVNQHSYM